MEALLGVAILSEAGGKPVRDVHQGLLVRHTPVWPEALLALLQRPFQPVVDDGVGPDDGLEPRQRGAVPIAVAVPHAHPALHAK